MTPPLLPMPVARPTRRRCRSRILRRAALLCCPMWSCAPLPSGIPVGSRTFLPVYIIGDEGLVLPPISGARARTPAQFYAIDLQSPDSGSFAAFTLAVSTASPTALRLRMVDAEGGTVIELTRVNALTGQQPQSIAEALPDELRTTLLRSEGVYWIVNDDGGTARVGVLLSMSMLSPFTRLEVYGSAASDGTPIGADRIEIVPGFFHMAVLGDSVAWGNGLDDRHKYSTLVMRTIERELGLKVIRQVKAHSGARIVPAEGDGVCTVNCSGEVPRVATSITAQAELIEQPELIDFILMDGCINDVGITDIFFNPSNEESLADQTNRFCHDEMLVLLGHVRDIAPRATIVVTGYFPVVSPQSDIGGLQQWASARGQESEEEVEAYKARLVGNSSVFHSVSRYGLGLAVDVVAEAAEPDDPPIALVIPPFEDEHATFTPNRRLWSLTAENELADALGLGLSLFPEDESLPHRLEACDGQGDVNRLLFCLYSSVAHPNVEGARVFADAIIARLRTLGMLPGQPAEPPP
jgi:hypothetical protein